MADTLAATSALQPLADRLAALPRAAAVREEPFTTMVNLRVDAAGPGGAAVAADLGMALPATATHAVAGDSSVIWLGPDEWLVTGTALTGRALEERLRAVAGPHGGVATDVSAHYTTLRLRGAHARDVLAKGCAIDLHPGVFGAGSAAQTLLGRAGVILLAVDPDAGDYRILVRSSFARHTAAWLMDAAEEYAQV